MDYIIYIDQQSERQSMPLSSNGYESMKVGVMTSYNLTSYNLTKLKSFTYYSILVTVSGEDVDDAPFEMEILEKTNATGEVFALL